MIQTTTSSEARSIEVNEIVPQPCERKATDDPDDKKIEIPITYIKIKFRERKCCNKVLYILYRILRIFMVSFWYYFMPFLVINLSFFVPHTYHSSHQVAKEPTFSSESKE